MIDYSPILKNIEKHILLSEDEKEFFFSLLEHKTIPKKGFLTKENQTSKYTAFVTNGCLRSYYIDQNGFEHILQFAPQDWWIGDIHSLITQKPGQLNIDAITNTEVLLLSTNNQELLYEKVPKFERFFRIILEKSLVSFRQRVIDNMSLSAGERYANFCKTYPSLINTLPQKQIAYFIGVTPEFLSKLRRDFQKEDRHGKNLI
jgi:CRP-like cAMP-binding protein